MKVPFSDLKWQHTKIKNNLKKRWDKILENTAFVFGDEGKLFEKNYAKYCGVKYCAAVSNGTSALVLALKSLNSPKGSEVITLPTSFVASAAAIIHAGFIPRFSEVDLSTGNYDYNKLQEVVNKKTKVIMAVHLYGRMAEMDKIKSFAKKNNLLIIEDAAQAQGATFKGKKAGSLGDVGCFSFYPGKNLGAYGEAGAVTTDNENIYNNIRKLRDHGGLEKYVHEVLGYNERLDNLQASVLDEKLKHLDKWNEMRRKIAKMYYKDLKNVKGLEFISPNNKNTESVYHIFALRIKDRNTFATKLKELGISTNIHYPDALHTLKPFLSKVNKKGAFAIAEKIAAETISLPIFPGMTDEQVKYVIKSIKQICK